MERAIEIRDLWVTYRSRAAVPVEAVRGLTCHVDRGEVVGFLGPNGAGKSSTLKALMGFVPIARGEATILGRPAGSVESRTRIGYLPEVALYYPYLTPYETLCLYGQLQGLSPRRLRDEARDLLALLGLEKAIHKQNRTLSKGMLQRVGIAQALLGSPELLVLDEVTSGLDPVGRKELRALLRERQRIGCTLFFSSHELAEVEMLCDRILIIDRGRLIDERKLDELQEELRQFVLVFTGAVPLMGLTEEIEPLEDGAVRARFADKRSLLLALERVQRTGGRVLDVTAQEGSLEDYFVRTITGVAA